jgi:hypothetical protein
VVDLGLHPVVKYNTAGGVGDNDPFVEVGQNLKKIGFAQVEGGVGISGRLLFHGSPRKTRNRVFGLSKQAFEKGWLAGCWSIARISCLRAV